MSMQGAISPTSSLELIGISEHQQSFATREVEVLRFRV